MEKNKKLIPSIIMLTFTLVFAIGPLLFAWYIHMQYVHDMNFNVLQIDSLVTLYEANDSNYNGIPDLNAAEYINKYYNSEADAHVPYENRYHDENYSFDYVDQRYALSQDSEANLFNILTIDDAIPSKIYGYKFEITNYVGAENTLNFSFEEDANIDVSILKDFEARLGIVNSDSSVNFTEWTNFCTEANGTYTYSGITLNPLSSDIIVPAISGDLSVGRIDLWLQVRINKNSVNDNITEFKLPMYRLSLAFEMADEE